jgi:hypothetical protein
MSSRILSTPKHSPPSWESIDEYPPVLPPGQPRAWKTGGRPSEGADLTPSQATGTSRALRIVGAMLLVIAIVAVKVMVRAALR